MGLLKKFRSKPQDDILDRMGIDFHSLFAGLLFIGMTGSGKTSAIRPIHRGILPHVGCCFAAVKASEVEDATKIIKSAGRTPRYLSRERCNVLAFLLNAPGGSPMEVTRYFERLNQILHASKGGGEDSSFWATLFARTMTFAITVVHLAKGEKATLNDVHEFVATAPDNVEFYRSKDYEQSEIGKLLRQASENATTADERRMVDQAISFWVKEFSKLGTKAVSAARSQVSGILGPLITPPFFDVFCAEDSTFTPDDIVDGGECLILDWPVLVWGDGGKIAQNLFLQMTKSALLRRGQQYPPVAFVADEFQLLVHAEFDVNFSTVARSAGAIQISATQSISVLTTLLGGTPLASEQCKALMNCHGTHIVLGTNDSDTANFYSSLWGEHRELFHSFSDNHQDDPHDILSAMYGSQLQVQNSQQMRPRVTVDDFTKMRNGSPAHGNCIDAFVTQGGKIFPDTGLPYRMVTFSSLE